MSVKNIKFDENSFKLLMNKILYSPNATLKSLNIQNINLTDNCVNIMTENLAKYEGKIPL